MRKLLLLSLCIYSITDSIFSVKSKIMCKLLPNPGPSGVAGMERSGM